jgi:hypothetical protein
MYLIVCRMRKHWMVISTEFLSLYSSYPKIGLVTKGVATQDRNKNVLEMSTVFTRRWWTNKHMIEITHILHL